MQKKYLFKIEAVFLTYYSSKNPEKNNSHKNILNNAAIFSIINNKKCVLSTKSAY